MSLGTDLLAAAVIKLEQSTPRHVYAPARGNVKIDPLEGDLDHVNAGLYGAQVYQLLRNPALLGLGEIKLVVICGHGFVKHIRVANSLAKDLELRLGKAGEDVEHIQPVRCPCESLDK